MSRVLSTAFYLSATVRTADRAALIASFAQDLICYDEVRILTDQMAAIGPLLELMPTDTLLRAVKDGDISFVHDREILAWPRRRGYRGVVPVSALASVPTEKMRSGFTQVETRAVVEALAQATGVSSWDARQLGRAVAAATADFGGLPPDVDPGAGSSGGPAGEAFAERVSAYADLVASCPELGLREGDLRKLEQHLLTPALSPLLTKKWNVMRLNTEPGWEAIETPIRISKKQARLLNLYIADRILGVVASVNQGGPVHTDATVERVFRARVDAIRRAVGAELDDVLEMARVPRPILTESEGLDFTRLLSVRKTKAGRSFRAVVASRDENADETLIQAYYKDLGSGLADRFSVGFVRLMLTTLADFLTQGIPIASAVDAFLTNRLLARADARFFIDYTLPRALGHRRYG